MAYKVFCTEQTSIYRVDLQARPPAGELIKRPIKTFCLHSKSSHHSTTTITTTTNCTKKRNLHNGSF